MISIVNVTPKEDWDSPLHSYKIFINNKFISRFEHVRSEGLSVCLSRASLAVNLSKEKELSCYLESFKTLENNSQNLSIKKDKRSNNGKHQNSKKFISSKTNHITKSEVENLLKQANLPNPE